MAAWGNAWRVERVRLRSSETLHGKRQCEGQSLDALRVLRTGSLPIAPGSAEYRLPSGRIQSVLVPVMRVRIVRMRVRDGAVLVRMGVRPRGHPFRVLVCVMRVVM